MSLIAQRKRIALLGYYGIKNLGDDAVVAALISNIRCRIPGAEVVGISLNPEDTRSRHGIRAYPIRRITKAGSRADLFQRVNSSLSTMFSATKVGRILVQLHRLIFVVVPEEMRFLGESRKVVHAVDTVVVAGSGILRDDETSAWHHPFNYLKWALITRWKGRQLVYTSVGAGPLNSMLGRLFVRLQLAIADYRSCRSKESIDLLRKIGFKRTLYLVPDQAFILRPPDRHHREDVAGRRIVAFNPVAYYVLHRWPHSSGIRFESYIDRAAEFLRLVLRSGYDVVFFHTQIDGDEVASLAIRNRISAWGDGEMLNRVRDTIAVTHEDVFRAIAPASVVVTSRFHGAVFGYTAGKPLLGISVDHRVNHLMTDMGQAGDALDIDTFQPEDAFRKCESIIERSDELAFAIDARVAEYRRSITKQFNDVFGMPNEN